MRILLLSVALAAVSAPGFAAWQNVAGEWDQYRLNETQMNWFKSVRSKQGIPCCDISDGHPTEMEVCQGGHPFSGIKRTANVCAAQDGYYIPNPMDPSGTWLRIPDEAMTTPRNNPIGVATVWYVQNGEKSIHIRCFVAEAES